MTHEHTATERQITAFIEDAMSEIAVLIRVHELCPKCASESVITVLSAAIAAGLIKEIENYTDEERQRLPYFTEAADGFFYRSDPDDFDCIGTA